MSQTTLRHTFSTLTILLFCATATAFAQGPYTGGQSGSDGLGGSYPTTLCASHTSNTCVIAQFCSPFHGGGACAGSGAFAGQESGGLSGWIVDVYVNGSKVYQTTTNGSGTSEGYIVNLGTAGSHQLWSWSPNAATASLSFCTWSTQPLTANNAWNSGSNVYYRAANLCN